MADLEYVRWNHYTGRAEVIIQGLLHAPNRGEHHFWEARANDWLSEVRREPRCPLSTASHHAPHHHAEEKQARST